MKWIQTILQPLADYIVNQMETCDDNMVGFWYKVGMDLNEMAVYGYWTNLD